jgi:hypothetical protein
MRYHSIRSLILCSMALVASAFLFTLPASVGTPHQMGYIRALAPSHSVELALGRNPRDVDEKERLQREDVVPPRDRKHRAPPSASASVT